MINNGLTKTTKNVSQHATQWKMCLKIVNDYVRYVIYVHYPLFHIHMKILALHLYRKNRANSRLVIENASFSHDFLNDIAFCHCSSKYVLALLPEQKCAKIILRCLKLFIFSSISFLYRKVLYYTLNLFFASVANRINKVNSFREFGKSSVV